MVDIEHARDAEFHRWLSRLADIDQARVASKLTMLRGAGSNLTMPHVRRLGRGLNELRVDKYRLYFVMRGGNALMLVNGTKDTQQRDIQKARGRQHETS